ncbi:MAG: hypothetical protein GXP37_11870 [Chloroflexi bacterium]|nr:hypothetical protein [Chloroflexota bacterium]
MLQAILTEIQNAQEPLDLQRLSEHLDIDVQALQGMIQFLVRKGRLQPVAPHTSADTPCSCGSWVQSACPGPEQCPFVYKLPPAFVVRPPHS